MKNYQSIIVIVLSFVFATLALAGVNSILFEHLSSDDTFLVYLGLLSFYLFTESGSSLLGLLRAERRRKKIQEQLDYERAIRRLSGEDHY